MTSGSRCLYYFETTRRLPFLASDFSLIETSIQPCLIPFVSPITIFQKNIEKVIYIALLLQISIILSRGQYYAQTRKISD